MIFDNILDAIAFAYKASIEHRTSWFVYQSDNLFIAGYGDTKNKLASYWIGKRTK